MIGDLIAGLSGGDSFSDDQDQGLGLCFFGRVRMGGGLFGRGGKRVIRMAFDGSGERIDDSNR